MFIQIFGIAEYWGTQSMYSSDHVFCDLYIYMHVDAHLFDDGVSFVRTWMRFMICLKYRTWMQVV